MKLRYRNEKGQFVKASDPGAQVWGYQEGRKFVKADPSTVEVRAFREKNNRPVARFRANGKFISREAAELLTKTQEYKQAQREKAERYRDQAEDYAELVEGVPFFSLVKDFKELFVEPFGFQELIIDDPEKGAVKYTNLNAALEALNFKGYQGAKVVQEASKGKELDVKGADIDTGLQADEGDEGEADSDDGYMGAFNIGIQMGAPGFYYIKFNY